jgi:nitrogen fixation/metabolism regulation signal transduction histidine kinase
VDDGLGKSFDELNREFNEVIDAFKKTKTEKEENFNYLLTVIQHVSIGVLVFTRSGKVDVYNNAVKSLLQVKHLRNIRQLTNISEELSTTLLEAKPGEKKLIKIFVGNELLQLSIHSTEFLMHGEEYLLVSLQDIHPELEQKEVESWQMLIRVLTHEIMNSITPISSLASTVQDILKEFQKEKKYLTKEEAEDMENITSAISTIERRSKGLLSFVDLYRNLTRIPKPHFRYFPIATLFQRTLELMEPKFENLNIQISTKIFPGDLKLLADPDLMDQVLINLLLNAVDAVKEKGSRQISLMASVNLNNRTLIEITDNGSGINQDIMDKIFMPFFTSKKTGSGIGLSLSRQIMQMHKGSLSVRSAPGKGATFILVF